MSNGDASPSVEAGPELSPDQEDALQEDLRKVHLDQAEEAVAGIEATIEGLKESLKTAKAEVKRLKDGGRV